MNTAVLSWLVWAVSASVSLAGLALAAWALFGDRSRGRRRCGACWYDMSGTAGLACPECGRIAKHERKLFRARRRWGWFCVGLLLTTVVPWGISAAPRVRNRGWIGAVPSLALVVWTPWMAESPLLGFSPTGLAGELAKRIEHREISKAHIALIERYWASVAASKPTDERFTVAADWLREIYVSGLRTDWGMEPYRRYAVENAVDMRPKWVADRQYWILLRHDELAFVRNPLTCRFWIDGVEATSIRAWPHDRETYAHIGPLAPGTHTIEGVLSLMPRALFDQPEDEPLRQWRWRRIVEIVPKVDDLMRRMNDVDARNLFLRSIRVEREQDQSGGAFIVTMKGIGKPDALPEVFSDLTIELESDDAGGMRTSGPSQDRSRLHRSRVIYSGQPWMWNGIEWKSALPIRWPGKVTTESAILFIVKASVEDALERPDATEFWEGEMRFVSERVGDSWVTRAQ